MDGEKADLKLIYDHANGLGESLNDINTYYLQQEIGHDPSLLDASPYFLSKLVLHTIDQKYHLRDDYFEADQQNSYEILREAINKKTKVNISMFPDKEPIEVVSNYCDSMIQVRKDFLTSSCAEDVCARQVNKETSEIGRYFNL